MTDNHYSIPAAEFDIIIRREGEHGEKGAYRASVVGHADTFGVGAYPREAIQSLNIVLFNTDIEKRERKRVALRRIRDEVRRAAGLPRWTWGLPSWAVPKSAERTKLRDALWDGIIEPYCKVNPEATYEEVADHAVAAWRALHPVRTV